MQEEWDWVCESEKERQALDYYSLTREEATVFGIQPHLTKQLSKAYERFEAAIDLISMDDDQLRQREADRAVWPKWKEHAPKDDSAPCIYTLYDAADFMTDVCGIPGAQAYGWALSREARLLRDGIIRFSDGAEEVPRDPTDPPF